MAMLKVGVIGTGVMGTNHMRVYASLPDKCELAGIYDSDPERARKVAAEYEVTAFASLDQMLATVDAVSITVPTAFHLAIGLQAMVKGVHVLIEKPIAANLKEADELIACAAQSGLVMQVGHIELFNPAIHVLKRILEQEAIIAFDIHRMGPQEPRNQFSDVVHDLMIHDIYILQYLLGDRVAEIKAVGRSIGNVPKYVSALMRLDSGIIAQLTASQVTEEKVRMIRIVTEKAFIQADLLDRKIVISRSTSFYLQNKTAGYRQQNIMEKVQIPAQEPLRLQIIHFLECVSRGTQPIVSGLEGRMALAVSEQVRAALGISVEGVR